MAETVKAEGTVVRKPVKQVPTYGVINKANYSITVSLKNGECLVLPPRGRTKKAYVDGDIASVESMPFATALAKGYVTIYR